MPLCPCGTKIKYTDCCEPFINANKNPQTPEELMRSRYTAYTQANIEYILKTMKAPAANHFEAQSAKKWSTTIKWMGLEVLKASLNNTKGFVEFIAHFNEQGKNTYIHEISEFHQINGVWFYVDGNFVQPKPTTKPLIGRNDLCPCGSKRKYKKCCLGLAL